MIRTHEPLRVAGFQDRCNRPLCHASCGPASYRRACRASSRRPFPRGPAAATSAAGDKRTMHQPRALLLLALLAACGAAGAPPPGEGALRLRFEDREEPAAFSREGSAVPDDPDGAAGLWVAVRGLPRPERAEVVNTGTAARSWSPSSPPRGAAPNPPLQRRRRSPPDHGSDTGAHYRVAQRGAD